MTLIERLRSHAETKTGDAHVTCGEAADQIESLLYAIEVALEELKDGNTISDTAKLAMETSFKLARD